MAPFNSALLNTTPTPEPEMCPTSPAKITASSMEHKETGIEKAHHVWAALLHLYIELDNSVQTSSQLGITLELDDEGMKQLTEGKHIYRAFMKEIENMNVSPAKDTGEMLIMAPSCMQCNSSVVICGGVPGKCCPPCAKTKLMCLFSHSHNAPVTGRGDKEGHSMS
ncbi:hypothetical protein BDR04DRAFT_1123372 [Suillus decipiens]|nr:hypothetical protein BDR04DRAFT_1123372 [Suillus decipiens]